MKDHAIIIGASIAGLAAAAALSPRFRRVTILERRDRPNGVASIAPHGRLPHVLLRGGAEAIERLLPGVTDEMYAAGAGRSRMNTGRWWSGGWRVRPDVPSTVPIATRALIESTLRRRVEALPNVDVVYSTAVSSLVMSDGRVRGVSCDDVLDANGVRDLALEARTLAAELVVDASGRGSPLPRWLEATGCRPPPVTEVGVDLHYQTAILHRRPDDLDGDLYAVVQNMAPGRRLGLAIAVEGARWMVVLGSYFGDRAPADRDGFLAFADSLPVPDIAQLLRRCEPAGEMMPYRFASSRRVHYERMNDAPGGLVMLGDTMASFNPLYGQGMSVAIMQAEQLGICANRVTDPVQLSRVAIRKLARVTDLAWNIATGADFAYPETIGDRPRGSALIRRYVSAVIRACTIDPVVAHEMQLVQGLVIPAPRLLSPRMMARVWRANRRIDQQPGRPAVVQICAGVRATDHRRTPSSAPESRSA